MEVEGTYSSTYFTISVNLDGQNQTGAGGSRNAKPGQIILTTDYRPTGAQSTRINSTAKAMPMIKKTCNVYGSIVAYDISLQNGTVQMTYDDYTKDVFVEKV